MLELQILLILTVRRQASEKVIAMDMRENKFVLTSRDKLRRSLQRLANEGVVARNSEGGVWVLVSYQAAKAWCAGMRAEVDAQERVLKQTESLVEQMAVVMDQLEDQIDGEGRWHHRWIKQSKTE